jgi:hypothetical protein
MDILVLIGAIIGLYVVVALVIYGTRLGRPDDDVKSRSNNVARRPRKGGREYWL